jgi:hypothetical protein
MRTWRDLRCTGIAEDLSIRQPELIFLAPIDADAGEMESRLDATEPMTRGRPPRTADAVAKVRRRPAVRRRRAVPPRSRWRRCC